MPLQFRPRDPKAEQSQMYMPNRDLAFCYPNMLREALAGLAAHRLPAEVRQLMSQYNVTDDDLAKAVTIWVEAHKAFVHVPGVSSAPDAMAQAGWDDLPLVVQLIVLARFGAVMTGGFFVALRDTTKAGERAPQHDVLSEMVAMGHVVANYLCGSDIAELEEQQLEFELQTAKADIELCHKALDSQTERCVKLQQAMELLRRDENRARAALQSKVEELSATLETWKNTARDQELENFRLRDQVQQCTKDLSWFQSSRICRTLKRLFAGKASETPLSSSP